jgi:hypothetical protein
LMFPVLQLRYHCLSIFDHLTWRGGTVSELVKGNILGTK